MFELKPSPEMLQIFAETRALREALIFIEQGIGSKSAVQDLIQTSRGSTPGPDGWLIEAAKTKMMTGTLMAPDLTKVLTSTVKTDAQLFQYLGHVWVCWAAGDNETARFLLHQLPPGTRTGSALHLMTLTPWRSAILNLATGSKNEARRFYRRAMEIGSQVGTETSAALQWTYVASYFH